MITHKIKNQTSIDINQSVEGETLENKLERVLANSEPIKDGAPIIYTPRSEGVKPAYDIRTDRFEIAVEGMDKVDKSFKARRDEYQKKSAEPKGAEPTAGKGNEPTQ